jgi:hypothetical protein
MSITGKVSGRAVTLCPLVLKHAISPA